MHVICIFKQVATVHMYLHSYAHNLLYTYICTMYVCMCAHLHPFLWRVLGALEAIDKHLAAYWRLSRRTFAVKSPIRVTHSLQMYTHILWGLVVVVADAYAYQRHCFLYLFSRFFFILLFLPRLNSRLTPLLLLLFGVFSYASASYIS